MNPIHQMKTIFLLCLMAFTPRWAEATTESTSPIKKFTRTLSKENRKQVNKIGFGTIPLSVGRLFVEKEFRPALRRIKKVRILHIENSTLIPGRKVDKLLNNIKQKQFDPLLIIKDGATKFELLFKDTGKKKKELVLLAKEDHEINVIEIKVKLNAKQIKNLFENENVLDFFPEF